MRKRVRQRSDVIVARCGRRDREVKREECLVAPNYRSLARIVVYLSLIKFYSTMCHKRGDTGVQERERAHAGTFSNELASPIEAPSPPLAPLTSDIYVCTREDCPRARLQKVVVVVQRTVKDNLGDDIGKHWRLNLCQPYFMRHCARMVNSLVRKIRPTSPCTVSVSDFAAAARPTTFRAADDEERPPFLSNAPL